MGFPAETTSLERYLGAHVEGFRGPINVGRFEGGQSNPTFLLTTPGARFVLRKKPDGVLLKSAHAVDREFRVTQALFGSDVPVAEPLCYCEDPEIVGAPFFVSRFVEGRILWDPSLPGMSVPERAAIYDEMNRVAAALHRIDYAERGLSDYGRPDQYVERQLSRWTQQYRNSETTHIESMENLIEWLPENVPASEESAIAHGDLRLDNLMFHPTQPRVLAVLDWELSTIGHPLVDLSYHTIVWRLRPDEFRGLQGHPLNALGIPDEETYVQRYCERIGRPPIDPAQWTFYAAFNLFRLAAILQGIQKRALDGTAADAKAFENGRKAPIIADAGWRQVQLSPTHVR